MNITDLTKEARAAYISARISTDPLEEAVKTVAHSVIEECMREVMAVQVHAPDAQIVKDKINAQLRQLAAQFR